MNAPGRFVPRSKSTFLLAITGYEEKRLSGVLHAPLKKKNYVFDNLVQLLLLLESLMDAASFPQQAVEPRAFQVSQSVFVPREVEHRPVGALATFEINVMFRQNASWQGSVIWSEQMMESRFRSVLELVGLMDDALSAAGEKAE